MPTLISFRPIRLLCDLANPNQVREQRTGIAPTLVRGSPTVFQIALALDGAVCSSVASLITSLSLQVRESADPSLAPLMSKTVLAAAVDNALTQEQWLAKTHQHAAFEFTALQCNLTAGTKWLTVWFTKANGDPVSCALGTITVREDGAGDPGTAVVPTADHYTRAEADARYMQLNETDAAFRVSPDGAFLQLKDAVTAKWRSFWLSGGGLQFGDEVD